MNQDNDRGAGYYKIETENGLLVWEGLAEDRGDALRRAAKELIVYEKVVAR